MEDDRSRLEAHLSALRAREAEALTELAEANGRADVVRARAIDGELGRIARRRAEIMIALPRVTAAGAPPRRNRGD